MTNEEKAEIITKEIEYKQAQIDYLVKQIELATQLLNHLDKIEIDDNLIRFDWSDLE